MSINERISVFEDLPNELIYEIFAHLHSHHAFEAFHDLNERFRNLFHSNSSPIQINISSISYSLFYRYLTQIILPHTDRIQSLRICHHFAADMYLFLLPVMNHFSRLEILIIHDIDSTHVRAIVDSLFSLSVLSSLVIKAIGIARDSSDIYRKIFRLPALKYCHMHINIGSLELLSPATNEFSSIEYLIIGNAISLHQLNALLSYVPRLHRLSLGLLMSAGINSISTNSVTLHNLINVSLNIYYVSFNHFESLVTSFFRQTQIFRFTVVSICFHSDNMEYLDATRWEQFISIGMPNLRIFDFQYQCCSWNAIDRQAYQTKINEFDSVYWTDHQWFFECQYDKTQYYHNVLFYSTNPYR